MSLGRAIALFWVTAYFVMKASAQAALPPRQALVRVNVENKSSPPVVLELASQAKADAIVALQSKPRPVSLKLERVPFEQAMDMLCERAGLQWTQVRNLVIVTDKDDRPSELSRRLVELLPQHLKVIFEPWLLHPEQAQAGVHPAVEILRQLLALKENDPKRRALLEELALKLAAPRLFYFVRLYDEWSRGRVLISLSSSVAQENDLKERRLIVVCPVDYSGLPDTALREELFPPGYDLFADFLKKHKRQESVQDFKRTLIEGERETTKRYPDDPRLDQLVKWEVQGEWDREAIRRLVRVTRVPLRYDAAERMVWARVADSELREVLDALSFALGKVWNRQKDKSYWILSPENPQEVMWTSLPLRLWGWSQLTSPEREMWRQALIDRLWESLTQQQREAVLKGQFLKAEDFSSETRTVFRKLSEVTFAKYFAGWVKNLPSEGAPPITVTRQTYPETGEVLAYHIQSASWHEVIAATLVQVPEVKPNHGK